MERVTIEYAREHLDELIARAVKGEDVQIADPKHGDVQLLAIAKQQRRAFAPLRADRIPGQLTGKMKVPKRLMEPMSEEELRDWYGDDT